MGNIKQTLKKLPIIKELAGIRQDIDSIQGCADLLARSATHLVREEILAGPKYADPLRLNRYEGRLFSQNGEDGIISEILHRIGTHTRNCVEFGVENNQHNTGSLLLQGWKAFWLEGSEKSCAAIRLTAKRYIESGQLVLGNEFITRENIASLFGKYGISKEIDLLSIDIDRNTSHVWRALKDWRPRVVIVEYNASFSPSVAWEIPYDADLLWNGSAYFGASLLRLEEIGRELGYSLVGCDLCGVDAFFVRDDLAGDKFCRPYTASNHYEPPRYFLSLIGGHRASLGDV